MLCTHLPVHLWHVLDFFKFKSNCGISSVKICNNDKVYLVKFDGGNHTKECHFEDMIGGCFQKLSDVKLRPFQKTYITYNEREVAAYFDSYKEDQLYLSIPGSAEEKQFVLRQPSEVRLLDKRRSQRLQHSPPLDYKKMIEEGSPHKGRCVSASIEVPKTNRIRKTSEEPTMTELMAAMVLSNLSSSPVFHNPPVQNLKGASPQSFESSGVGSWNTDAHHLSPSRQVRNSPCVSKLAETKSEDSYDERGDHPAYLPQPPPSPEDPIDADSDMILIDRTTPTSLSGGTKAEPDEELPDEPQDLRMPKVRLHAPIKEETEEERPHTAYSDSGDVAMVEEAQKVNMTRAPMPIPGTIPISLQPGMPVPYYFAAGLIPQQYVASFPLQIASTPPPGSSAPGHIDTKLHRHLHRAAPYHKDDSSVPSPVTSSSPSAITFGSAPAGYYFPTSPIPVSSLSFSPTHKLKRQSKSPLTTAPPVAQPAAGSSLPQNIPSTPIPVPGYAILRDHPYQPAVAQPISIPGTKAFSWQNTRPAYPSKTPVIYPHMRSSSSPKPPFPLSPKSIPLGVGRKVRGDGKKCRKVYGMENRELWCTACRWKKACQRFPD